MNFKRTYHFSRKIRQIKNLRKQISKASSSNAQICYKKKLTQRFLSVYEFLESKFSEAIFKKLVSAATITLFLQLNVNAQTSNFADPVINPFNIHKEFFQSEEVALKFADFDNDGDNDMLAFDINDGCDYYDSTYVYYLENVGNYCNPSFQLDTSFQLHSYFNYVTDIEIVDIDLDGDLDVFIAGKEDLGFCQGYTGSFINPVHYYINNIGSPTNLELSFNLINFSFSSHIYGGITLDTHVFQEDYNLAYYYEGQIVDIDGNGDVDLIGRIVSNEYWPYQLEFYTVYIENIINDSSSIEGIEACLVTQKYDSDIDSFVVENLCGSLKDFNPNYLNEIENYNMFDINNDGLKDILSFEDQYSAHDTIFLYSHLNNSINGQIDFDDKTLFDKIPYSSTEHPHNHKMIFEDIDNDGDADFFISALNGDIYFYENLTIIASIFNSKPLIDVELFPNPVREKVVLAFKNEHAEVFKIELFDINGNLILKQTTLSNVFEIETNNWSTGFYLYELESPSRIATGKFIVQ